MRINRHISLVVSIAIVIASGLAYANRMAIRDAYERLTAPALPQAEEYKPVETPAVATTSEIALSPSQASSTSSAVDGRQTSVTSTEDAETLPNEKLLAVPFMSQAPFANWDAVHEETCEEASVLMVSGYYAGKTERYEPGEADKLLLDLVKFQQKNYGFFEDTSATETKRLIEDAFPELAAEVVPLEGPESVKRYLAEGVPVILPADGKTLPNPNFRNGGPRYHMLVVRGYTADRFITNDPGTRKGENFLYTYDGLLNAVHDWNNGDVPHGRRVMIIVRPKQSQ